MTTLERSRPAYDSEPKAERPDRDPLGVLSDTPADSSTAPKTVGIEGCDWERGEITLPMQLGEVCLARATFSGVTCRPDVFSVVPVTSLRAPVAAMQDAGVDVAYAYSLPIARPLPRVSRDGHYVCIVDSVYQHYYVDTHGDFQAYLAAKKKKTISTLKRKIKKAEAANPDGSAFHVYETPSELAEFLTRAFPVSEKSYQQRLFGQGLPNTDAFRAEVMAKSEAGQIFGYLLTVNGDPVAYNLCPIYGRTKVLYDYTGFDADYSEYSPGTILQFKIIEDLYGRDGIDFYDLCTGEGAHKELFATGSMLCANVYFCRSTLRLRSAFAGRNALLITTDAAKRVLDRVGLAAKVKKLIRKAA